ncbi:MAG: hypothetical protein R3D34_06075 [Nitratireductor sp.]
MTIRQSLALFLIAGLAACQAPGKPSDALSLNSSGDPTDTIVVVAQAAQKCWFKSKDKTFTPYRLANEVNAPAGRPRFLLVPRRDPGGLPLLVVQAENKGDTATGKFTHIQTFGPLLSTPAGQRITNDIKRWSSGNTACA